MIKNSHKPPFIAEVLLKLFLPQHEVEYLLGDYQDIYSQLAETEGTLSAWLWYWRQVIKTTPVYILHSFYWGIIMFKNYFITALRDIKRQKIFAFIKIAGLSIGIAVCILLSLYIYDEISFDRFHKNADNIYRIINKANNSTYVAPQVSQLMKDNFPEISETSRILPRDEVVVRYKEEQFNEKDFIYTDENFFKIFSFELKNGDPETVLKQPFSIVITENIALKYFGNNNPIGEKFEIENEHDYTITGVAYDFPANSHFNCNFIATLVDADKVFGASLMQNWGWENFLVYSLFRENFSITEFEKKTNTLLMQHIDSNDEIKPSITLQALKDIHLYSNHLVNDIRIQGDINYVLIFSGIGILILLTACFNYIYLVTANSATRSLEVGIKKVIGATKKQIARQFFGESIVVLILALLISLCIVVLSLPFFNSLTGKSLSAAALLNNTIIAGILILGLITGFIAGSYPALYISAISPIKAIKGTGDFSKTKFSFNRILVVIQFTFSVILIISSIFMFRQLQFIQNKKLGFDKEQIVVVNNFEPDKIQNFELFKNTLLQNKHISSISSADRIPSNDLNNWCSFKTDKMTAKINMPIVHVSYDYFKTLGINKPSSGRFFSEELKTDLSDAIILNESAVNKLALQKSPVGNKIKLTWPNSTRTVVGVVKDFHFESLYQDIKPAAFVIHYPACWKMMIKIKPSNIEETLENIEKTWKNIYPSWTYEYHFMDDRFEQIYNSEKRTFQLMGYFSLLAIFISCLGLYGLATFTTKRRFKEIGMRKVLGASITGVVVLLGKDFTKWVLIANIIAWPVTYFAIEKWFESFAYHTNMSWWIFFFGGIISLLLAITTVGYQAIKAATINPVDSLKNE